MEMQENTWMQHLVAVHAYTQCNSAGKQTWGTTDTSLQQVNCRLYSFCRCRSQEELSISFLCLLVENGFGIFPPLSSSGSKHSQRQVNCSRSGTEDLSMLSRSHMLGWTGHQMWFSKKFSLSQMREDWGKLEPFLRSAESSRLPASLVFFHLTCLLVLHRCGMTAIMLLTSDPVAYSVSCDLCGY